LVGTEDQRAKSRVGISLTAGTKSLFKTFKSFNRPTISRQNLPKISSVFYILKQIQIVQAVQSSGSTPGSVQAVQIVQPLRSVQAVRRKQRFKVRGSMFHAMRWSEALAAPEQRHKDFVQNVQIVQSLRSVQDVRHKRRFKVRGSMFKVKPAEFKSFKTFNRFARFKPL
jgi:hypothetical protein